MARRKTVRFGRAVRNPIKVIELIRTGKNGSCDACGGVLPLGDTYVQLRLQSWAMIPCTHCSQIPARMHKYHKACVPTDVNKAMGFDPAAHQQSSGAPGYVPPPTHQVAPPPKPKSSLEMRVEAILVFEGALAAGFREGSIKKTDEVNKAIGTLTGLKSRIIQPGTPEEAIAATNVALKKLIDLTFAVRKP